MTRSYSSNDVPIVVDARALHRGAAWPGDGLYGVVRMIIDESASGSITNDVAIGIYAGGDAAPFADQRAEIRNDPIVPQSGVKLGWKLDGSDDIAVGIYGHRLQRPLCWSRKISKASALVEKPVHITVGGPIHSHDGTARIDGLCR